MCVLYTSQLFARWCVARYHMPRSYLVVRSPFSCWTSRCCRRWNTQLSWNRDYDCNWKVRPHFSRSNSKLDSSIVYPPSSLCSFRSRYIFVLRHKQQSSRRCIRVSSTVSTCYPHHPREVRWHNRQQCLESPCYNLVPTIHERDCSWRHVCRVSNTWSEDPWIRRVRRTCRFVLVVPVFECVFEYVFE